MTLKWETGPVGSFALMIQIHVVCGEFSLWGEIWSVYKEERKSKQIQTIRVGAQTPDLKHYKIQNLSSCFFIRMWKIPPDGVQIIGRCLVSFKTFKSELKSHFLNITCYIRLLSPSTTPLFLQWCFLACFPYLFCCVVFDLWVLRKVLYKTNLLLLLFRTDC